MKFKHLLLTSLLILPFSPAVLAEDSKGVSDSSQTKTRAKQEVIMRDFQNLVRNLKFINLKVTENCLREDFLKKH